MSVIAAKYEIVTPLVLGGANHTPEFRLASFVHLLRWWWRFRALAEYDYAPRAATFWEAMLFGWAAKPFGRKRVSFRLAEPEAGGAPKPWGENDLRNGMTHGSRSGIGYLTAQGFKDRKGVLCTGFEVEARVATFSTQAVREHALKVLSKPGDADKRTYLCEQIPDSDDVPEGWQKACATLIDAMVLIGLLGGMGARSRRGFGSLAVSRLEVAGEEKPRVEDLPTSIEEYRKQIEDALGGKPDLIPAGHPNPVPYSALSPTFRYDICASHTDARALMNDIGWAFQIYRSWGQKDNGGHVHRFNAGGAPRSIPAGYAKSNPTAGYWYKDRFLDDHENFYVNTPNGPKFGGDHPDNRAVFGLPHNYGNKQVGWDHAGSTSGAHNRRASPLLFHFHRLKDGTAVDGTAVFVASTVEAKFAPGDARLRVGGTLRPGRDFRGVDWSLIKDFAEFVRGNGGAPQSAEGGVRHTSYKPETGGGPS